MHFGPTQLSVMRSTVERWFDTSSHPASVQRAALSLHGRGLLARDPKSASLFTATPKGIAVIQQHDAELG